MFQTLNSLKRTLKPSFWIILAYFLAAYLDAVSFLAPVQTILPEANIRAVVFGSLILMITAANLLKDMRNFYNDSNFWIIFCISSFQRYSFEVQSAAHVHCGNYVPRKSKFIEPKNFDTGFWVDLAKELPEAIYVTSVDLWAKYNQHSNPAYVKTKMYGY